MTEKTYLKYLGSKGMSKATIDTNYRNVCYFLDWCEDENIEADLATYNEVMGFVAYLRKRGIVQRTVQIYTDSLRHYFVWLIRLDIREDNPMEKVRIRGIKRQKLHDIIPYKDLESLYEAYPIPKEDTSKASQNWYETSILTAKRNRVILGLMIWQGLGTTDLTKLRLTDVQLREGTIEVLPTRRSEGRILKLESVQVLDLMEYIMQVRPKLLKDKQSENLLVSSGGSNKLHNTIQRLIQKLNALNPRIKTVKQIRASVITHWVKCYNLREAQHLAGHRYVSSTESYLINDLDDLMEDINKFHPISE